MAKQFKYQHLLQELLESFRNGTFAVGERLPTEKELASRYNISVHTVRQAMNHLRMNGVVKIIAGSGTYLEMHPTNLSGRTSNVQGRSCNIGILVWDCSVYIFPRIINAAEKEFFDCGYNLITCNTQDEPEKEREVLERLLDQNIRGLIISPIIWHERRIENYKLLLDNQVPFVFINRTIPGLGVTSVILNNELGAYLATKHLINLGHREIGHLTSQLQHDLTEERIKGYKRALEESGLPFCKNWLVRQPDSKKQVGYEGGLQMLDQPNRPTAVFCVNDELCTGLINAAWDLGLKIPQDLSIVGFDNSAISTSYFPFKIDSVHYPAEEMGRCAARELILMMNNTADCPRNICMEPKLIVRETSMPPARAAVKA